MRRLIINADDFGLTSGVNRGIAHGSSSGVITSATVMANGQAFSEAVSLAKNSPRLKTGCHVVLVDGSPLSRNVPTLLRGDRHFRSSFLDFAGAAMRGRLSALEIQREAEAQIRKIQDTGLTVTHVDSHKHTHMFPQVFSPLLRAARACGVKAVRNPFEPLRAWPGRLVARTPGMWLRCGAVCVFQTFRKRFERMIADEGLRTTDGSVAVGATGKLNQRVLLAILEALPPGTWELVCHPGYADDALRAAGTRLVEAREVELGVLTSPEVKERLREQDIKLISYADL